MFCLPTTNLEIQNMSSTSTSYRNVLEYQNITTASRYNPLFLNDVAPNQDPYTSFGPDNLARLKRVKQSYDPKGFFTTRQGGFKLPT